jgi:hypothetical protein
MSKESIPKTRPQTDFENKKTKISGPYSQEELVAIWNERKKTNEFGLHTPVQEGPFANEQLKAKLKKVADHIDKDLSAKAIGRLFGILSEYEGFKIKSKRKPGEYERKRDKRIADRLLMVEVRIFMLNKGIDSPNQAVESMTEDSEDFEITPRQFYRVRTRHAENSNFWELLMSESEPVKKDDLKKFRQAVIEAGDREPTDEEIKKAESWAVEHPATLLADERIRTREGLGKFIRADLG